MKKLLTIILLITAIPSYSYSLKCAVSHPDSYDIIFLGKLISTNEESPTIENNNSFGLPYEATFKVLETYKGTLEDTQKISYIKNHHWGPHFEKEKEVWIYANCNEECHTGVCENLGVHPDSILEETQQDP